MVDFKRGKKPLNFLEAKRRGVGIECGIPGRQHHKKTALQLDSTSARQHFSKTALQVRQHFKN
jgi:hypothetical protein